MYTLGYLFVFVGKESLRKFEESILENSGIILEPPELLVGGDNQMKDLVV